MYSNNDFRDYQELYHAEGEKKKWNWLPGGKNPPEYNHWYYMTHPEKWDITKKGKEVLDAAGKKVNEFIDNSETELDNKLRDATKTAYDNAKNKVTSSNAYQTAKNIAGDVRKSTELMDRRDKANRRADTYANRASEAEKKYQSNHSTGNYYAQKEAVKNKNEADKYNSLAEQNRRSAARYNSTSKGYLDRASNAAKSAARNTVGNAIDSARLGAQELADRVGTGIKDTASNLNRNIRENARNNRTQVDDALIRAVDSARRGSLKGVGRNLSDAGREAGKEVKNALGSAVSKVTETADKLKNAANAYGAYRNLEKANRAYDENQDAVTRNARTNAENEFNKAASRSGGQLGVKAGDAKNNLINQAGVAKNNAQNALGTLKNKSIIAAQTASMEISDIYSKAKDKLSDIGEKFGWNSPEYLRAVKDTYSDVKGQVTSLGSDLRTRFENAPGTVNSAIESGLDWISNGFYGLLDNIDLDVLKTKNKYDEEIYTQGGQRRSSNSKK